MAKGADYHGDRGINGDSTFLSEESRRGRLPGGAMVTPRPQFTQPDNGTHMAIGGSLGISYDPTTARLKSDNVEKDLNGGLY